MTEDGAWLRTGLAGLTAAKQDPSSVRAVQVIDISLRMLHLSKQAPWQRPLVARLQRTLRESRVGVLFFGAVAKPKVHAQKGYWLTSQLLQVAVWSGDRAWIRSAKMSSLACSI